MFFVGVPHTDAGFRFTRPCRHYRRIRGTNPVERSQPGTLWK